GADRRADCPAFFHHRLGKPPDARVRQDPAEIRAGQRADGIERDVSDELAENLVADAFGRLDLDAVDGHGLGSPLEPRGARAVGLAEQEAPAAVVLDRARFRNARAHVDDATDRALRADARPDLAARIDDVEPRAVP